MAMFRQTVGIKSLSAAQYLVSHSPRPVTPMRLLKLLYVSHGYSLGINGVPLLNEPIHAWQYGPIIQSVYQAVRHYRSQPVESVAGANESLLTDSDRSVIDRVVAIYGDFTAIELSAATHQPGSPWSTIWGMVGKNAEIPNDLIRGFYLRLLESPSHSSL